MYLTVSSIAPSAIPRAWDAIPILPPSRVFIASLKPLPSLPRRFSLGILQSSKISSQVEEPLIPILSSGSPTVNPGVPLSTMKAEIPWFPLDLSVIAMITNTSANPAFVIKIFDPLSTYSSPSSTAVVLWPLASVPAPGSVRPKAPIFLPASRSGKYFFFCSSVPFS